MLNQFVRVPSVSVIIPVHNGGDSFRQCLDSLLRWATEAEVIVVADGESDKSWQLAEEYGAKVIRLTESKGPANARNQGAKAASADILFFIDADVAIHAKTVVQVRKTFEEDPALAALIGSYDDAPGAPNFLSQYKNLFHHYMHQQGREEASTFWGACGAIRRDIFLKLGGFDASYRRPCIEDIELGYRLRHAGYKIRLCKHIYVKHLKRWSGFSLLRAEIFYRALPWMALLLRLKQANPEQYRQVSSDLNLQWSSRLSVVLIYGICVGLLLSGLWPVVLWGTGAGAIALFVLNLPVYAFFYRKRGVWFAVRVLPWHWLYYFYSGLAFVIGTVRHQVQMLQINKEKLAT